MITYHNGDLLSSGCNIICHQVNLQGVMGGGIALQIARKYPECEREYKKTVEVWRYNGFDMLGVIHSYRIDENHFIANCFTQDKDFNTDYSALRRVLMTLKPNTPEASNITIGFPYGYGCGIANGKWELVENELKLAFEDSDVDCQIWRLGEAVK